MHPARVSFSGRTFASQANNEGSIPFTRSRFPLQQHLREIKTRHLSHEHVHVRQFERWGLLFPILYVLASFRALLTGKRFYWDNVFEIEARNKS